MVLFSSTDNITTPSSGMINHIKHNAISIEGIVILSGEVMPTPTYLF